MSNTAQASSCLAASLPLAAQNNTEKQFKIASFVEDATQADEEPGPASTGYLIALTCSTGGLQVVWSAIMSNGTPFLITLGLPESLTALVWVAAPLAGVLVQPYVGILSDRCQNPWGRRRPFILAGAVGTIICMMGLALTRSMTQIIGNMVHADLSSTGFRTFRILVAIGWLYSLNIFIQPLQAGTRALIVDNCKAEEQSLANAWASRITGVGNIVGYLFGYVSPKSIVPVMHVAQFTWLCIVASLAVIGTVAVTCIFIKEQDPQTLVMPVIVSTDFSSMLRHIVWSFKTMPKKVKQVCQVQFFAWMGWFPFLFYVTSFIGDLYAAPRLSQDRHLSSSEQAEIIEDAVRRGSLASLLFAIVALLTSIILPFLLIDQKAQDPPSCSSSRPNSATVARRRPKRCFQGIPRLTITRAWSLSHLIFALAMLSTLAIRTRPAATVMVSAVGLSWALTQWVPFALIGTELAARRATTRTNADVLAGELAPARQDQAGAIGGLHNCAIAAPQMIAALVCSAIFWAVRSLGAEDGIGWVFRAGGCAALVAAWLARRMEAED